MQALRDYEGKDIKDGEEKLLVRRAIFASLNSSGSPDSTVTPADKEQAYLITSKCYASETPNFKSEEITMIKKYAKIILSTLTYGRLVEALEKTEPVEEKGKEAK